MTPQQELAQHYLGAEALKHHLATIAGQYDLEPSSGMAALERECQILRSRIVETANPMNAPWPETEDDVAILNGISQGVAGTRYLVGALFAAWAAVILAWKAWA